MGHQDRSVFTLPVITIIWMDFAPISMQKKVDQTLTIVLKLYRFHMNNSLC